MPPPTALFGEAVLFLNHCGCAGWSAHLLFAKPRKTVFSHRGEIQYSSAHVLNSEHTNSGQTCFTFGDEKSFSWFQLAEHAYSNLNYLCNINEIGYPLRPLSSAHKTIQQILNTQCQINTMDTWTQIQSISRYNRRGVRGTIDLSII